MTRVAAWTAAAVLLLAVACADVPQAPGPADVRLAATDFWAGDTLRLHSQGFSSSSAVTVDLNGQAATTFAIDDTTLALELPVTAGDFLVTVSGPGVTDPQGVVHTHGFRSRRDGPVLHGYVFADPARTPVFYANDSMGLSAVNAFTGASIRSYPRTIHDAQCIRGPGPSYEAGRIVLTPGLPAQVGSCAAQRSFQLEPGPPVAGDSGMPTGFGDYNVAQLGQNVWFKSAHHSVCVSGPAATPTVCTPFNGQYETVLGARISPRGDRATVMAVSMNAGLGVWNAQTGAVAYTIPGVVRSYGVAFSGGGDTLYVVARTALHNDSNFVLAFNATTGAEIGRRQLARAEYADAFVTGDGRRLITSSVPPLGEPGITVIRLPDLTPEAVVRSPAGLCQPNGCRAFRLVGDGMPYVHAVGGSNTDYNSFYNIASDIFSFDLKP